MAVFARSLLWQRLDTIGVEHVVLEDRSGLTAQGTAVATDPVPYTCRYELATDAGWGSTRFEVMAEGARWQRTVRLERAGGRWRVTAAEQGDLDEALGAAGRARAPLPGCEDPDRLFDALDVDLGASPLTNTLPLRRLDLVTAPVGTTVTITVAWVLVPSLFVMPATQTYTVLDAGRVRFGSDDFTADIQLDRDAFVVHYPGLADRVVTR